MFSDRIYCETNQDTGLIDCYCRTREGVLGPFDTEQMAIATLQGHIKYSGGRYMGLRGSLGDKSISHVQRIFCQRDEVTGMLKWCCDTREGILGPFDTKESAFSALRRHIKHCPEHGLHGGRDLGLANTAEMVN